MGYQEFDCDLYIERRPLSRDWVLALCRELWQRGARINTPYLTETWDEQLAGVFPHMTNTEVSLSDHIDRMVENGMESLHFWDRGVVFTVDVSPEFQLPASWLRDEPDIQLLETLPFGLVTLRLATPQAGDLPFPRNLLYHPESGSTVEYAAPETAYLIRPKYQAYLALAHWTEVLSLSLNPLYGVGYHHLDQSDDNAFWHTHHQRVVRTLAQGQLPEPDSLLTNTPLRYASPRFVSEELIRAWASQADTCVRLLPNGGLLASQSPEPYDIAVAREYRERSAERSLPAAERLAYIRRSNEIFALYGDQRTMYRLIAEMRDPWEIADLNYVPDAGQTPQETE
jgi:hypothetical protein